MTLALTEAALAPVSDLSDVLLLGQYQESATDGVVQSVRRYAGGRRRVVAQPGSSRAVSVAFRYISRANYNSVLGLVGSTVLFRDQRQRRVFGILSDVSGSEYIADDLLENIQFTITEITYSEIV